MSEPAPVIAYASAVEQIRYRWLLRFAQAMGGLPLAVGVLTLILFIPSRHEVFVMIGLWTIVVGCFMVGGGFIALLVYRFTNWLKRDDLRRQLNREFGWTLFLLAVNFPVAFVCTLIGVRLMDHL